MTRLTLTAFLSITTFATGAESVPLDGVPFLYNGQEVADTARHSIFGKSPIDWGNGETPAGESRLAFCKILCTLRHTKAA